MSRKPTVSCVELNQRWLSLPLNLWQTYWASVETIGYRLPMLADGGLTPDARQRAETSRMVNEKLLASAQSLLALWAPPPAQLTLYWLRVWSAALQADTKALEQVQRSWLNGSWPQLLGNHILRAVEQGLRPWHQGATANARRLRKRQR
ncbi:hypothetical protein [Alkalilimnicola sp. S0819]|uniref:hypothetical protein n=1 Tax=Alkalilimnicola sp. S0819 TaxID=2613922 RepID=UPI00126271F1|nr:hypothetical protein [Alkalilimnicola sp. S0819]KAB7623918.1 hypothetical protein F3N43_07675 [Alkalilimnicola sp. S0819]MPQ16514.1 hypothetical protein [Alkalilimnicola sp. S0819]